MAVVAGLTGGDVEVTCARTEDIEVVAAVLAHTGIARVMDGERFRVEASAPLGCGDWERRSRDNSSFQPSLPLPL